MFLKSGALALALSLSSIPALAADGAITILDPYARVSSPAAKSGAAFMQIMNSGPNPDRLVSASSPAAARVELHTHIDDGNGVMLMREIEGGFEIPAEGAYGLARGGDHVMFLGLKDSWSQGDRVPVTLFFENAGEIALEIPVDLTRKPKHGGHGHGGHHGHSMGEKTN